MIELDGSGVPMGYYARGHVDKAAFVEAADWDYEVTCTVEEVEHVWYRNVPAGDSDGGMVMLLTKPGRGAYPVTQIDLEARAIRDVRARLGLPLAGDA
jgi:hypothetical protein